MTHAQIPTAEELNDDEWLTSAQIKAMFHLSPMALWRWVNDEKLNFPQPVDIRRRNFWRKSEIDAFNARMVREAIERRKK